MQKYSELHQDMLQWEFSCVILLQIFSKKVFRKHLERSGRTKHCSETKRTEKKLKWNNICFNFNSETSSLLVNPPGKHSIVKSSFFITDG